MDIHMILEFLQNLKLTDTVITALAGLVAWTAFQWRQSESAKQKSDEIKLLTDERNSELSKNLEEARSRIAEVENAAIDLKNEMPSLIGQYFQEIDNLLTEGLDRLQARLKYVINRVRELELELAALKKRSDPTDDQLRKLIDKVKDAHEEIEEVEALRTQLEQKHILVSTTLPVLLDETLKPDIIEAAQEAMDTKLRRSSALRTTDRVVARERASMSSKSAATNSKYKKMQEKIEMLERKVKASQQRSMKLPDSET